jgi:hypothetical protein
MIFKNTKMNFEVLNLMFLVAMINAVPSTDSFIRMSGTDLLRNATFGNSWSNVLVLLYTSPVNSKESAKILETWSGLGKTLSGLITVAAVDCDEFSAECSWLGIQLCPHVLLLVGGEIESYAGPMTAKSIFLFASNRISSPVAQIDRDLLDWWISTQDDSRYCVVLFQNDQAQKIPWNFMSLSRDLLASHSLAEIRVVDQALKDRFKLKKLPSVLSFPCNNSKPDSVRVYDDELSKDSLSDFLMPRSNFSFENEGTQRGSDVAGLDFLDKNSVLTVCPEMCLIIFIKANDWSKGKDLVLQVKLALNALRTSRISKNARIPKVVWISTKSKLYLALRNYISVVDIALWKFKRNRVAVFQGPSESQYIAAFIDNAISGSHKFFPLDLTAHELVSNSGEDEPMGESVDQEDSNGPYVAAGVVSWTCPSNLLLERRTASLKRGEHHIILECFTGGRVAADKIGTDLRVKSAGHSEGMQGQADQNGFGGVLL